MGTQCIGRRFEFQALGQRQVVASFDGGRLTSDGGGLLLREVESKHGLIKGFAQCFTDHRDPDMIEHTVYDLLAQRVYGLALGYEDLSDHDQLRTDELLAALVGKEDLEGARRSRARDRGKALAGKSTLNRLELTPSVADASHRYKKIVADMERLGGVFTEFYIQAHPTRPDRIVLDLDATDDPIHGEQEGRFFHGYYGAYCYLPLYIFAGDSLLWAQLRSSDIDASAGAVAALLAVMGRLWEQWPGVEIVIRGDSGFCREEIMRLCEAWPGAHYVLGLAKNARLLDALKTEREQAQRQYEATGKASRVFGEFEYRTAKSWSRARRVVGKAEHLSKGANPRFVVTSFGRERYDARSLYEEQYCARGEMENRIKEQLASELARRLDLFADRTSAATMRANQLRLWFSSLAYTLIETLRREGLKGTEMEQAQCATIRTRLLKIGARVAVSVRRVVVSLASGCPYQDIFARVFDAFRVPSLQGLMGSPPGLEPA